MNKQLFRLQRGFSFRIGDLSLRSKLLLAVTSLTVLSVGTLAITNFINSRNALTENAGIGLKAVAVSQASAISEFLAEEAHVLKSFNLSKLVQDRVDEVNASYGPDETLNLQQIELLDKQWRVADEADNNNVPIVNAALNSVVASELREFRETFPENVEVFVTDKRGALIASTNRTSDYYQADEGWWQAAYNNGEGAIYYGQPEYDESSHTFGVIIAVPIFGHGTNKVSGVMRTTLNISEVIDILDAAVLGGTGHTELFLPSGEELDPEESTQGLEPGNPDVLARLSFLTGETAYDTFSLHGEQSVVSAAPVTSVDRDEITGIQNLGWVVIVHQRQADNLAPVRNQTQSTLLIALLILVISAAVAAIVAQTLSNPIVRLTAVAQQIAAGDTNVEADEATRDEIGTLARAFNKMTLQLREFITTLEQQVADRTRALTTSIEVSRRLSTILDQKQLVTEVVQQVQSAFNYYHAHIYLVNETGQELILAGGTGEAGRTLQDRGHKIPKGKGLVGRAADTNMVVLVSDTASNPDWLPNPLLPETKSEVAVPIAIGDYVLGVLDVQHNIVNGLRQKDADLLASIANQVAIALQNARQYAEAQSLSGALAKRAIEMETVSKVSAAASTLLDARQLLQTVVDLTKENFNLYHAHIYLMNDAHDTLVLTAGAGEVGKQMVQQKRSIPLSQARSLVVKAAMTKEGQIVNDVAQEPDFLPNPLLPNTRSEMSIPMILGNEVVGVFDIQSDALDHFTDEDVRIQTSLAAQVTVALQNARTYSQAQRQADRESMLNSIGQKIQSATTVEAVLQIAARELGRALNAPLTVAQLGLNSRSNDSNGNLN